MKKILSLLLAAVMLLSCLAGISLPVTAKEDISGVETISFARNGVGGSPYMSGLNKPVGYAFKVDPEKRLLSITIPEFATYNNNTNKGTFKLYTWKGDRGTTVAQKPLLEMDIVNHVDHDALTLEIDPSLKLTGDLYFEVICLEGASYTPWNAEGGLIDPIPGKVTDMQAYLDGNPANPFACEITIADMENKSASAFVTFTYDFSKGLVAQEDYNQTNQIRIENKDGYVTFVAEGEDPYFRFSDNYQPTTKTNELAYAVIEYRTTASIAAGEIFTNRKSGAHWGDPNSYVTWNYIPDGEWHTVVVDASQVWGNDANDELYAFRFDPLVSGAQVGDSIDVASIKFFADGLYANSYAADREATIKEDEALLIADGSRIVDFGAGSPVAGLTAPESATVYTQKDFTRLVTENSAEVTVSGLDIPVAFRYLTLVGRTKSADPSVDVGVTLHSGASETAATVTLPTDGYWAAVTVELPAAEGTAAVDSLTLTIPAGWVDITYIGLFEKASYAEKYTYPRALNTHEYVFGSADVPVYNVTDPTLGSPFCSGGQSMGQKFTADFAVRGIIIPGHATWGADPHNNSGYFKLFNWNTDYNTTVSGTPIVERELSNLKDGEDLVITFDELPAGEYCFEIKMTTPGDKAYTGFNSAAGGATPGTVSFRNGQINDDQLVAGYLTTGVGLKDVGAEYGMDVTFEYDFTKHYDSVTEALGLNNMSGMTVTDLCDQGYLAITAQQNDPFFAFGVNPTVTSNLMDHIVIKYRTASKAKSGELFVERTDGAAWGQPYDKTNIVWDWNADGEWQIAIIDASSRWGNVYDVLLTNIRFDPLEKPETTGESIDVAYIKFFANGKAAEAYAETEYVTDGDKTVVRPPLRPLDPSTVKPVILFEGETMTFKGGNQMRNAEYDFDRGCVTLQPTGSDPQYYLYRESTKVAPFMAVRYRTSTRGVGGEIYVGSVQNTPNGRSDRIPYEYITDGEWHTVIIDLRKSADYNRTTNTINYLRFDFLHADTGLSGSASIDLEYIAFFETVDEATVYLHTLPAERNLHTATFVVNGKVLYQVEFRAGDASLDEPVVPILPGMIGAWEPYTLGDADITVNAVYTPTADSNVPDVPPLPSGEETGNDDPETNVPIEIPTEPDETEELSEPTPDPAESNTPIETTDPADPTETTATSGTVGNADPAKKGCGSSVGMGLVSILLLAAAWVCGKKRDRL